MHFHAALYTLRSETCFLFFPFNILICIFQSKRFVEKLARKVLSAPQFIEEMKAEKNYKEFELLFWEVLGNRNYSVVSLWTPHLTSLSSENVSHNLPRLIQQNSLDCLECALHLIPKYEEGGAKIFSDLLESIAKHKYVETSAVSFFPPPPSPINPSAIE